MDEGPLFPVADLDSLGAMRSQSTDIISAMKGLFDVFELLCDDNETLQALSAMASNHGCWRNAHQLFHDIRQKTLAAEKEGDELRIT